MSTNCAIDVPEPQCNVVDFAAARLRYRGSREAGVAISAGRVPPNMSSDLLVTPVPTPSPDDASMVGG